MLAKPNDLEYARLGVIVSRKISKRAVDRNYIKRSIREFFRNNQQQLGNLDVVIRARKIFGRAALTGVHEELTQHFIGLKKCHAYLSS